MRSKPKTIVAAQRRIARDTLKMDPKISPIMGQTHSEAKQVLKDTRKPRKPKLK